MVYEYLRVGQSGKIQFDILQDPITHQVQVALCQHALQRIAQAADQTMMDRFQRRKELT